MRRFPLSIFMQTVLGLLIAGMVYLPAGNALSNTYRSEAPIERALPSPSVKTPLLAKDAIDEATVIGTAASCAGLLAAAAAAGAAVGVALGALPASSALAGAVGNVQAAVQLGSWSLVLEELGGLLAVLNTMQGAATAIAYVTAAIAKIQALIALMGTDLYKNCAAPGIALGEIIGNGGVAPVPDTGIREIPASTCGHEPVPGRGWTESCNQCCTRNVNSHNDNICPASADPARTTCQNLVNRCVQGCNDYRQQISNGSQGGAIPASPQ